MVSAFSALCKTVAYGVSGLSTCYCLLKFGCSLGKCEDVSMEPTIQDGDLVLICSFYVRHLLLQKGDIVFSKSPNDPRSVICKRIVAMEGDTVFNNEKGLAEYVGKGHVWLEGDNKEASVDSRYYGPLPYGLIISKVTVRTIYILWSCEEKEKTGVHRDSENVGGKERQREIERKDARQFDITGMEDHEHDYQRHMLWPLERFGFLDFSGSTRKSSS